MPISWSVSSSASANYALNVDAGGEPWSGTMTVMVIDDGSQAAQRLADQAHQVGCASGREAWREAVQWITRGRFGRPHGSPVVAMLTTPWQDTVSANRIGWRQRAANLNGELAFAVNYQLCHRCRLGWVEQPYTLPRYRRCGLASAALAALRAEHPDFSWHTLGGHSSDSRPFWAAVGAGVAGSYNKRPRCPHAKANG
jgi:hypothetical protein